jgi:hypothetical protein
MVSGESSSVLELAGVEKRLVVAGEFERIAGLFGNGRYRFWFDGTVPRDKLDNSRSP